MSVGGRNIKPGLNIYRFANRIPLLFEVRARRVWAHRFAHRIPLLFEVRVGGVESWSGTLCSAWGWEGLGSWRRILLLIGVCGWQGSGASHRGAARSGLFGLWRRSTRRHTRTVALPTHLQGGSDVITRTALKRINWSTYKINQSSDKVGDGGGGGGGARTEGCVMLRWGGTLPPRQPLPPPPAGFATLSQPSLRLSSMMWCHALTALAAPLIRPSISTILPCLTHVIITNTMWRHHAGWRVCVAGVHQDPLQGRRQGVHWWVIKGPAVTAPACTARCGEAAAWVWLLPGAPRGLPLPVPPSRNRPTRAYPSSLCAADDVEEIQAAVRAAIQQCCVQLKSKIARQQAAREQKLRKKNLTKYIPNVAAAVYTVLQAVAKRRDDAAGGAAGLSAASGLACCCCLCACRARPGGAVALLLLH